MNRYLIKDILEYADDYYYKIHQEKYHEVMCEFIYRDDFLRGRYNYRDAGYGSFIFDMGSRQIVGLLPDNYWHATLPTTYNRYIRNWIVTYSVMLPVVHSKLPLIGVCGLTFVVSGCVQWFFTEVEWRYKIYKMNKLFRYY